MGQEPAALAPAAAFWEDPEVRDVHHLRLRAVRVNHNTNVFRVAPDQIPTAARHRIGEPGQQFVRRPRAVQFRAVERTLVRRKEDAPELFAQRRPVGTVRERLFRPFGEGPEDQFAAHEDELRRVPKPVPLQRHHLHAGFARRGERLTHLHAARTEPFARGAPSTASTAPIGIARAAPTRHPARREVTCTSAAA